MAAIGARTAVGDAGGRILKSDRVCRLCRPLACVPARVERSRVCRRPQRGDRIPLGRRQIRSIAGARRRSRASSTGGDRHGRRIGYCGRRKVCNQDNSHCVPDRRRSGQARSREQPQPPRRQHYGSHGHHRRDRAKAIGVIAGAGAARRCVCSPHIQRKSQHRDVFARCPNGSAGTRTTDRHLQGCKRERARWYFRGACPASYRRSRRDRRSDSRPDPISLLRLRRVILFQRYILIASSSLLAG